jgi:hypothetical protein
MNNNPPVFSFLKKLLKSYVNVLSFLVGGFVAYFGGLSILNLLYQTLLSPIFDLFEYYLFDGKTTVLAYLIALIGLAVSIIFFIKAYRNLAGLMKREPLDANSPWLHYGKTYFILGIWFGLCYGFLFLLVIPIL